MSEAEAPHKDGNQLHDIELTEKTSSKESMHTQEKPHSMLAELAGGIHDLPSITVAYKNVTVDVDVEAETLPPNVLNPVIKCAKHLPTCFRNYKKKFARVENASGVLHPGSMTLVLSPPGHGKTSLLKAISSRIKLSSGTVYFNGRTPEEAQAEGVNVRKLTQYVDQVDSHLPLLTVRETLDYAHKFSTYYYDSKRVDAVISILGLDECKDTIIGNALIRGVSGGQRRRVSIGEMLVGDARAIFLDEFSNGLDTATAEDIGRGLRDWVKASNGSIIATLQQPTPGMLELFDDVILMREANIVYQGPRQDILPYLASMGFHCPDDVDVCDFIIDCLSQPRVTIANHRNAIKKSHKEFVPPSMDSHLGFSIIPSEIPCVTTEAMIQHFKKQEYWTIIQKDIDKIFAKDKQELVKESPIFISERATHMYSLGFALPIPSLFGLVLKRQWVLGFRNKALIVPRIMQSIVMGLLYGSLYYQSGDYNYFTRIAALVICLAQVAFGSMIELPSAVQANPIAYKQISSRFFPSWMLVASTTLASMPMAFVQTLILGLLIYFMNGAVANAWNFILFVLIMTVQAFCLASWYRMLSITSRNETSAQSIAGPSTGVLIIFAGLFLSPSATPDWLIWLYWLSPFSWSVRALANNEFLHHKYDEISDGVRLGTLYLRQLDMRIGYEWIGYAFIYTICLGLFLMSIHSYGLYKPYFELSIGTRRMNEEEIVPEEDDVEEDEEPVVVTSAGNKQAIKREMSASEIVSRSASSYNESALKTMNEHLPTTPTWLSFRNIKYTVPIIKDKVKSERTLLQGISGYAEPGKLTALMGASGAGKTTLLDVLAGRKNIGVIEGSIKLNGHSPSKEDIAHTTGYVEQFDSLLAYDTVRETLTFAARLRLPRSVPDEIKLRVVNEVMEILELTSIQDLVIGNSSIPGLSPSQTKRVNIGVELVANPAVLFLDEPTTGLDSRSAQTVMRVVRRIARSGRSVICTIHQPSAELFYLFDRLVLLANGGYQIYFGNLGHRSKRFIKYLSSIPGVKPIPPRYNPASWMLEELGVGVESVKKAQAEAEGREYESTADMIQRFGQYYINSPVYEYHNKKTVALDTLSSEGFKHAIEESRVERHVAQEEKEESKKSEGDDTTDQPMQRTMSFSAVSKSVALPTYSPSSFTTSKPTHWAQFTNVTSRHMRMYWRSTGLIYSRFLVFVILSFMYGCIFFNLEITTQATAMSFTAAIILANNSGALTFGATSLAKMIDDRVTFYREKSSGFYQGFYWAIASVCTEIPWIVLASLIGQIPSYFLIGLNMNAGKYFKFTLTLISQALVYVSNSLMLAAISPSPVLAQVIQGIFFSLLFSFMGISIPLPIIPKGYVWLYHALPMSHLGSMFVMPQLETCDNLPYCGPVIEVITSGSTTFVDQHSAEYLSDYLGWKFNSYWTEFGWTYLYIGVVLLLGFVALQFCNHAKR